MFSATTINLVNTATNTSVTGIPSAAKDKAFLAATIAMAALPLATSTLAFYLGWLSTDPVQAKAKRYRIYIASMQERSVALTAAHAELGTPEAHRAQLIKREKELYDDALKQNAAEEALAKAIAAEAFFAGRDPNELTIIANRETTDANYSPKASTLADVEKGDA